MSQEPEKKPKDDPVGTALLVIFGLIAAIVLLRFFGYLLSDGWSVASTAVPAGRVAFYIVLGFAVFLLGPWLMEHRYRTIGKVVIFCVAGVIGLTIITAIPSCNNDYSGNNGDLPYYRR